MTPSDLTNPVFRDVSESSFKADGARDATPFVAKSTQDATFQLGGNPAVVGRENVRLMLVDTFANFHSVKHTLRKAYELPDDLIYEALVDYVFKDGRTATLPYANIL